MTKFLMILIGILTIAMMRATLSTKRLICELKERKGEPIPNGLSSGKISPVLGAGFLVSIGGSALGNSDISSSIVTTVQIIAIILMLIGLYQSRKVLKK